ncbi:MAG: serine/threonine protein kinase, partial [Candidatus Brocadiae bacterium]|nr:serine/threonine protein kinase [Candidatus Brocadiia bacterium]
MDSWIDKQIGKCHILEKIGSGNRGIVYKAKHSLLDKTVAIKFLQPEILQGQGQKESIENFLQEARACAKLEHPNIITVYDVGEESGAYYIIMQYIEGRTLQKMIDLHGKLSFEWALRMLKDVAKGLEYAHEKGFIHRDIKPANILVSVNQEIKIADFGTAKEIQKEDSENSEGKIYGTPLYMSPEQARGNLKIDKRSDLYSLGMVLYHSIVGEPLYKDPNFLVVLQRHIAAIIPSLKDSIPNIPDEIDFLFQKLVSKRPEDRFSSAQEVVEYIDMVEDICSAKNRFVDTQNTKSNLSNPSNLSKSKKIEPPKKTKTGKPLGKLAPTSGKLPPVPKNPQNMEYAGKIVDPDFSDFASIKEVANIPIDIVSSGQKIKKEAVPLSPAEEPALSTSHANFLNEFSAEDEPVAKIPLQDLQNTILEQEIKTEDPKNLLEKEIAETSEKKLQFSSSLEDTKAQNLEAKLSASETKGLQFLSPSPSLPANKKESSPYLAEAPKIQDFRQKELQFLKESGQEISPKEDRKKHPKPESGKISNPIISNSLHT